MISLDYYNKTRTLVTQTLFTKLLDSAYAELVKDRRLSKKQMWSVEVSLVGTKAITQLNTQYHNKPRPTDVVSVSYFQDMFEKGDIGDNEMQGYKCEAGMEQNIKSGSVPSPLAGEIFISVPYARMQAKQIGQSLNEELQFLFVHGLLHVFGYDHMKPDEEAHMLKMTYSILGRK